MWSRIMQTVFNQSVQRAHNALRSLFLVILLCLANESVRGEVRFDVFLGYDGTVRESAWFPITFEIQNSGPPMSGLIEIAPANFGKGHTQRVPVELPTGTLKRIVIPAFSQARYATPWDVRLIDDRGKVVADALGVQPQRAVGWETKLIGSVPRSPAGVAALRSIKRNQPDMQPASTRFQPMMLPDNPLLLESLDALYLNSEAAASLRSSQVNAIIAWVNAGGHLIVGIEQVSDVTAAAWLKNILPVEPKDIVAIPRHDELTRWLVDAVHAAAPPPSTVQPSTPETSSQRRNRRNRPNNPAVQNVPPADTDPTAFTDVGRDDVFAAAEIRVVTGAVRDGRVVVSAGEHPLIVTGNRGLGRVTALMFSPEREPFKSWKDLPMFWTRMLEVPLELYTSNNYYPGYGHGADGIFGAMLDSRQVHKLPVGWLLVLLVVYLLVIGPVDRIWLKKINKPMLTWITFPCYVMFFSGLIYFIGYRLRAGESELSELHIVDILKNGERAEWRGRSYFSIYSPSNARYPVQSGMKFATLRGEYLASRSGQSAGKTDLLHVGDSFKAEVFVPVWTSQLSLSDWWTSGDLPLIVTVKATAEGWTATVENRSGKDLSVSKLVVGKNIFDLQPIPANVTRTFTLKTENAPLLQNFVRDNAGNYQSAVQERQYAFGRSGGGRIDDFPTAAMTVSLLGEVAEVRGGMNFPASPGLDISASAKNGSALLLAWSPENSPTDGITRFKPKRSASNTLWRIPVTVQTQN
jgi:hypothetical protein